MKKTQSKKPRSGHLEFTFLGAPEIRLGARVVHFQSRKTTALLAYLMLEPGLHARDTLAALLWADSDRTAGRGSLRTALAEINTELGTGNQLLQANRDAIGWNKTVLGLDVQQLELAFRAVRQGVGVEGEIQLETAAALFKGDLLEGFDFSDALGFDDWLIAEREIVRDWFDVVLEHLCKLQAKTGKFSAALETAQRRVRLEPLSEIAYQSVIALQVQNGNRAAALEAYRACETMLKTELGLEPTVQTRALLEHPDLLVNTRVSDFGSPRVIKGLEVSTRLIGRTREWLQLEAAWQAGQNIYISAEAGVGKTRLMLEFAASKGVFTSALGRPGDQNVPFSSMARALKDALQMQPRLEIPNWARRELSRLIPELSDEPLPPISSMDDRLRLFTAAECVYAALRQQGIFTLTDDTQFFDDSSLELVEYLTASNPSSSPLRSISAFRPAEVSEKFNQTLGQMVDRGQAALIELKPLEAQSISEMLSDLIPESEHIDQLGRSLHQFTGGNPLFIIETMRALREQGSLETLTAERFENRRKALRLVKAPGVGAVISRRLERLTRHAKDLAQVAAIMRQTFNLERAAQILETSRLELAKVSEELQTAQLWRGLQFSHDLVFETVLENIPESTKVVLHGSVLDTLEKAGLAAAILATHAIGAQRLEATVRYSLKAGFEAFEMRALPEAIAHLKVVRGMILEPPSGFDPRTIITDNERFQMYYRLFRSYDSTGTDQRSLERQVVEEMYAFGDETQDETVKSEIRFVRARDYYYQTWGGGDYLNVLKTRLEQARRNKDLKGEMDILSALSNYEWDWDRLAASKMYDTEELGVARRLGDPILIFGAISPTAYANTLLDLWDESEADYDQVVKFNWQDRYFIINLGVYRAWNLLCLGRASEAVATWRENIDLLLSFDLMRGLMTRMWLAAGLLEMGEYGQALECGAEYDRKATPVYTSHLGQDARFSHYTWVLLQLGCLPQAETLLSEARSLKKGWNQDKTPHVEEYFCALFALQGDWREASEHALEAVKRREMMPHDKYRRPMFRPTWLETEALLRGGHDDLARQEVGRLKELARHYKRMQIPYFRALAVLEAWEKHLELSITSLNKALDLSLELGLPSEIWQINAKLAEVHEKNGDPKEAQKARDVALNVIQTLGNTIPDLEIRDTFLEFAKGRMLAVSVD